MPMQDQVNVVSADSGLADSLRFLLEAHGFSVKRMTMDDLANVQGINISDETIVIDLVSGAPDLYREINKFITQPDRPCIILLSAAESPLLNSDQFDGGNISVLAPPIDPKAILACVRSAPPALSA